LEVAKVKVEVERFYVDERGILRVLARVRSESNPGSWYGVYIWLKDGKVIASNCTCLGFVFRGECKHIRWVTNMALANLGRISKLQPG
jgi:hypothetical protein